MQVLLRAAISPNVDDPAVLDDLLVTEGWSTLMTIVHGSEGEFNNKCQYNCLLTASE
jgi:hypothetical protein